MIEISSNLRDVLAQLERFQVATGEDLSPLMRIFAGALHDTVEENFAHEGRPGWQKLASSTIKQRQKEGTWPGKILQRRGELAASVEPGYARNSAWVSTNKRYARIQQEGGVINRAAYGGTVRLRTDRKGNLLRQGKGGKLAIFAKDRQKHAKRVRFETAGFQIRIPARSFFSVTSSDQERFVSAAAAYIRSRWGK